MNIALLGKARSGKDSIAAHLVAEHGYTRIAFADPLKDVALALNPLVTRPSERHVRLASLVDNFGWEFAKENYPEVRRTLQALGVAVRAVDPDFWLNLALKKVAAVDGPVVVTDTRFPNEARALAYSGFRTVRVIRPDVEHMSHASETALDGYPTWLTLYNNDTLDALRSLVDYALT